MFRGISQVAIAKYLCQSDNVDEAIRCACGELFDYPTAPETVLESIVAYHVATEHPEAVRLVDEDPDTVATIAGGIIAKRQATN